MIVGFVITSLASSPLGGGGCRNVLLMTRLCSSPMHWIFASLWLYEGEGVD